MIILNRGVYRMYKYLLKRMMLALDFMQKIIYAISV